MIQQIMDHSWGLIKDIETNGESDLMISKQVLSEIEDLRTWMST